MQNPLHNPLHNPNQFYPSIPVAEDLVHICRRNRIPANESRLASFLLTFKVLDHDHLWLRQQYNQVVTQNLIGRYLQRLTLFLDVLTGFRANDTGLNIISTNILTDDMVTLVDQDLNVFLQTMVNIAGADPPDPVAEAQLILANFYIQYTLLKANERNGMWDRLNKLQYTTMAIATTCRNAANYADGTRIEHFVEGYIQHCQLSMDHMHYQKVVFTSLSDAFDIIQQSGVPIPPPPQLGPDDPALEPIWPAKYGPYPAVFGEY